MAKRKTETPNEAPATAEVVGTGADDVFSAITVEDQGEPIVEAPATTDQPAVRVPARTDADWHDYVMSQFTQEELIDNLPTVDGLYRVAQLLNGEVYDYDADVAQSPTPQNNMTAVVKSRFIFANVDGEVKKYSGIGEVNPANCEPEYARYAASFAETRAKGRALRQSLGLRRTIAAEEKTMVPVEEVGINGQATDTQFEVIDRVSQRLGVNAKRVLAMLVDEGKIKVESLRQIPAWVARNAIARLSEYQRDTKLIPHGVKGYDEAWRGKP
jgi:hypothetical protein